MFQWLMNQIDLNFLFNHHTENLKTILNFPIVKYITKNMVNRCWLKICSLKIRNCTKCTKWEPEILRNTCHSMQILSDLENQTLSLLLVFLLLKFKTNRAESRGKLPCIVSSIYHINNIMIK